MNTRARRHEEENIMESQRRCCESDQRNDPKTQAKAAPAKSRADTESVRKKLARAPNSSPTSRAEGRIHGATHLRLAPSQEDEGAPRRDPPLEVGTILLPNTKL